MSLRGPWYRGLYRGLYGFPERSSVANNIGIMDIGFTVGSGFMNNLVSRNLLVSPKFGVTNNSVSQMLSVLRMI